jgi:hypothetical protein
MWKSNCKKGHEVEGIDVGNTERVRGSERRSMRIANLFGLGMPIICLAIL